MCIPISTKLSDVLLKGIYFFISDINHLMLYYHDLQDHTICCDLERT